ncbi:MAG: hypothetical protein K6E73_09560 [Bacteroidales bacterium]|nr:hypothetical protein [Bacteroidales bacterium]
MIVKFNNAEERRIARLKLYKDDVFLIAHEALMDLNLPMDIVDLFVSAGKFSSFLLENDLDEREVMQYEIKDLRGETNDDKVFYSLLFISFVQLCALRKVQPNAVTVASALVGFCNEYEGFADLLKKLEKKERTRWFDGKRANLLTYELKCIEKEAVEDHRLTEIIEELVEESLGMSVDAMQAVEIVLSRLNDKQGHRFQEQLNTLRKTIDEKSKLQINIEKLNDIHNNEKVTLGYNGRIEN